MKLSTIVAAVAAISSLTGTAASAGPVGVAIQLSTLGYPFHHGQPTTFMLEGSVGHRHVSRCDASRWPCGSATRTPSI